MQKWNKISFTELISDRTKDGIKLPTNEYNQSGLTAIIDQGQEFIAGYSDETEGAFIDVPAIIFGDHTRVFKYVDFPFFLGADGVKVLKANQEINYKYLYYYFLQAKFPNTGYARHFKWLKELQIPLPPLETQKNIAAVLDKCTALIAKHKLMLEKYDTLIKSRFIEMFGDPVQNSKGYKYKKLEELGKWESGGTPSRKNNDYFKGSIPWYSAGELNSLYLYDSNEKITETAIEESSAKLFRKGSLFVGMYDTAAFKMGIATTDCSSNQACANIFPNRDVNVIWLYYELMEMKEFFLQNRRGVRQKNLNLGMIKGFEIPYAPSNLQNDFAAFVQQIDKSKFAVQKSLEKAETLYKSLMQEYFG